MKPTPERRPQSAVIVSMVAIALWLGSLGACANGDGNDAAAPSTAAAAFSAWHDEVAGICAASHAEVEELEQGLGEDPSPDEMLEVVRGTQAAGERALDAVTDLGIPDSRSDEVDELTTAMERQLALFPPIVEAGETGDAEALQDALGAPEVRSTQSHLDDVARSLDLPDCGTGEDGTAE